MIKKLILPFLLFCTIGAAAQLNNSWIDYSKTYYKFKLAEDNVYRIPQPTLAAAGLGATIADHYQLWRNGQQVRLYTPTTTVPLGSTDFIEFYGEMNDGKADKTLYQQPQFQLADRYSLETDTAAYFLTVNPASVNLRYSDFANPAPATGAVPDAFFMRRTDIYYRNQFCKGLAKNYRTDVFSSAYDNGEGPTSQSVSAPPPTVLGTSEGVPDTSFKQIFSGLNVYYGGVANSLSIRTKVFYTTPDSYRKFGIKVNNTLAITPTLPSASTSITTAGTSSLNVIANNLNINTYLSNPASLSLTFVHTNVNSYSNPLYPPPIDGMVVASLGITYPATFNFNNTKSFAFDLSASSTGNYLVIDNFNYGTVAPILYDLNNGRRYIGDIVSTPGKVKFVLPASTEPFRRFILNNAENTNIKTIAALTSKTFVDYNAAANKGDYIIISHPKLYNDGAGVNNVELYRAYRSSVNGGGYNAKITDINELIDQFGFGIKSHPAAVRDYVRFMDANYPVKPKAIFIIGRGLTYYDKKVQELNTTTYPANAPIIDKLDFVPTFGWPASDILLVSTPGLVAPITPVGRLGAITGKEVGYYYQKVLQYEQNQRFQSPLIADKAWMKNTIQIVGGQTQSEVESFRDYMNGYEEWIKDTLFGGHVNRFEKTSSTTIQQASNVQISQDFADGLGLVKYFGHSSATSFEFNLSDPEVYNNTGKYPFFYVSGCTAGNFYNFDPFRLTSPATLSEKYVLANQKGSIAFLADTHFGLGGLLDYYNKRVHENFCRISYGQTVGNQIKESISNLGGSIASLDFAIRLHLEEINLHGDPALKINNFPKPDYVIEPQLVKVSPSIITVSDPSFKVIAIWRNIGKATNDSIRVSIKRTLSNNVVEVLVDSMIFATRYMDSLEVTVPISPLKDKGNNKICVEIDNTNKVDEIYETNNKACTDFFVFEATLSPIFPYNYAIVNTQNITYSASTANPLLPVTSNYIMEIDTTALFNSTFKKAYNKTGLGGLIEFTPTNITFTDSTVYYWRTAVIPASGNTIWNTSSFVYLPASTSGYNVSHYFQYEKNSYKNIKLDTDRKFKFIPKSYQFTLKTAQYPSSQQLIDFSLANSGVVLQAGLYAPLSQNRNAIRFNIIDSATLNPWYNDTTAAGIGQYGSTSTIQINSFTKRGFYQFDVSTPAARQVVKNFLNIIPNGNTIVLANGSNGLVSGNTPINWASDPGANLYLALKGLGFNIDLVTDSVPFGFVGRKGFNSAIAQTIGALPTDKLTINFTLEGISTDGEITSDILGPCRSWSALHWKVFGLEAAPNDKKSIQIIGMNVSGAEDLLATVVNASDTSIAWINANTYPNLKLKVLTRDSITITPSQIKYLTLNGELLPEGAIYPSLAYTMRDTVDAGEPIQFTLAFKNVSRVNFSDSMKIGLTIRTSNNFDSIINLPKAKILIVGDTLKAKYTIPSENYLGNNTLIVDFNPNNAQLEQFHFNNLLYKNFYVRGDEVHPLLDVTFDGIHILNRDIVSAKPNILIKLKDENRFLALRDTGLLKVKIKYPGESNYRSFNFNSGDTMRFTPAAVGAADNTATINLKPYLAKDGDYELVVTGKDVTGNDAGAISYHSTFTVINKPMISEMLNYPNPFTTSTAFVFTLTGSEVPQNLRIQILTISGKVIKEITKVELGDIHIGRNITNYTWNGTDEFNQQVANGVYLYRVITNLNGKSLDKYKAEGDNSSKYFNKGYGKMYLMR